MLNNISFLNFKSNLRTTKNNNNQTNVIKLNGNNLKPLAHDTISFTGVYETRVSLNNEALSRDLHKDAREASLYFNKVLKDNFGNLVYDKEKNPEGVLEAVAGRVKTPLSIEEKIADKHEESLKPEKYEKHHFCPKDPTHVKEKVRDIVGGRLILRDSSTKTTDAIIDKLCKTIEDENLIVAQIENIVSDVPNDPSYFSDKQLQKLKNTANKVRVENGLKPLKENQQDKDDNEFQTVKRSSGYAALHMHFNIKNVGKKLQNRGFYSELQIIGADVVMLKDIEDLCYKLNKGKDIKLGHYAYKPFAKLYNEAMSDEKVRENFKEYTKRAFIKQRERQPGTKITDNINDWAYKYPTIEECGFTHEEIPAVLDFNILARIKRDCDDILKTSTQAEKIITGEVQ